MLSKILEKERKAMLVLSFAYIAQSCDRVE